MFKSCLVTKTWKAKLWIKRGCCILFNLGSTVALPQFQPHTVGDQMESADDPNPQLHSIHPLFLASNHNGGDVVGSTSTAFSGASLR